MNAIANEDVSTSNTGTRDSLCQTRSRLEDALTRITEGIPNIVKPNKKVTATTVAREAGVDRATLYRFHQPILEKIRAHGNPDSTAPAQNNSKEKEYRKLVEEAQQQVEALARNNYQLQTRVDELQNLLSVREQVIADLKLRSNAQLGKASANSVVQFGRKNSEST